MKSRRRVVFVVVLFTLVTSTAVLFAQHNHTASSDASPTMMQGCQKHRSEMGTLLDQMSKTLADGKELRSVEEMRAAMEKAQSQLAEVKQHMDMCPMAKDGMMSGSNAHRKGMKCMSDQQKTEGKDQAPK